LSASALAVLAPEGAEILGQPLVDLFETVAAGSEDRSERPISFLLGTRNRFADLVVRTKGSADSECHLALSGRPQFDGHGQFLGYRGSAKDVSDSFERQRDEQRLAQFDSLTGLSNRHRMARRLATVMTAYKAAGRSCALLMLDLDRFKQVNDTLGHPAGDELLRQVAQRLQRIIPTTGEVGRLGGDEFQVILPDMDDRGRLGELAHQIIQMLSQPYSIDGSRAIIGTSVGIAVAPYDGISPEELIKSADMALYAAKGGGRGQYRYYSNELQATAHKRRAIEEDLRDALANGELQVYYQPVVRAEDGRVGGFEALLRWDHPDHGWISPGVFMPVAEETNLVCTIGEWVLRQACADAAGWPGDICVAVNISAIQFMNDGLCAVVAHALASTGLPPARLELEITEGVFMGESAEVDRVFDRLKRLGVKLALDDFGTGYSSLGYLRRAPFDKIKIDQGFVRGCTEQDNANSAIIAAIVSLAQALDMETTAEGVETMDELALVRQRGATNVQGFIYSAAVSQDQVQARLESGQFEYEPIGPERYRAERRTQFRRVGVIHEDHHYQVTLRNLSRTGAMIEGLLEVPVGTELVLDLGEGQLAVAVVRRSFNATQGLEFETQLISDGADGLCTRHRISPYMLAAAGMPLQSLPAGHYQIPKGPGGGMARARFLQVECGPSPRG
ncbi:MAG: EAL domain-containing protein, partial [Croceibacterium sp.]